MLKWIQEQYSCEIVTLTVDIGQTADDLGLTTGVVVTRWPATTEAIKQKALSLGAKAAIVYDAKDQFADELLSEAILANADYQGIHFILFYFFLWLTALKPLLCCLKDFTTQTHVALGTCRLSTLTWARWLCSGLSAWTGYHFKSVCESCQRTELSGYSTRLYWKGK